MITQERFDELELEHGCGYWDICSGAGHECPCAITTENKGLQESIYNSFAKENQELIDECNREEEDEDDINGYFTDDDEIKSGYDCFDWYDDEY